MRNKEGVASFDKTLYDDYLYLVASNKQQIQLNKIRRKSTGTLDHWKLLRSGEFIQPRSSHCNEKCADRPTVSVQRCRLQKDKYAQQQQSYKAATISVCFTALFAKSRAR